MKPHTQHISKDADRRKHTAKELTTDLGINTYDFTARSQYPMASRFDQPDKKSGDYTWLSPYIFCAADPINFSDPTGMRIIAAEPGGPFYEWKEVESQWAFYDHDNVAYSGNDSFMRSLTEALTSISSCEEGMRLVSSIVNNENIVTIQQFKKSGWDETTSIIGWNISGVKEDVPVTGNTTDANPIINLAHELAHAEYSWNGGDNSEWFKEIDESGFRSKSVNRSEIYTTFHENSIRKQLGSPLRTHYSKDEYGNGLGGQIIDPKTNTSLYFDLYGNIHYKKIKNTKLRYRF